MKKLCNKEKKVLKTDLFAFHQLKRQEHLQKKILTNGFEKIIIFSKAFNKKIAFYEMSRAAEKKENQQGGIRIG